MAIDLMAEDYHCKLVIRDQKSDRSALLLVSEDWDPSDPRTGPAVTPQDSNGDDRWLSPIGGTESVGVLELDMTYVPSGLSFFDS
jgi:hypothetical protein